MIILYHDGIQTIDFENTETNTVVSCSERNIQKCLYSLSIEFKDTLLIWCHYRLKDSINKAELPIIFHHQLILASYNLSENHIISKEIGFIDQHCFINVKKEVSYPTWLMSSNIGGVNANVLLKFKELIEFRQSFDEFLCSLAKLNMSKGLLCYSEPNLLIQVPKELSFEIKNEKSVLFKFVKKHYKIQWVFILLLNYALYNKQFPFIAFIKSLFVKKNKISSVDFSDLQVKSIKENITKESFKVDVLIPTLGRKEHLYNVLKDLSQQTILPKKVIIVEQNAVEGTTSELSYLKDLWPFEIDHNFTHQLGACNARNIALSKVTGNWVFFADDDVRFDRLLLEKSYNKINKYGTDCTVLGCLQKGEKHESVETIQSGHFGSGTSIVKAGILHNLQFKKEHEFGFGEDSDFGMQLRNMGIDILSTPEISMLHLKAPIGGFRYQFKNDWSQDVIQPKPSPTVMAYQLKHLTKEQFFGYKTLLFIKFYKKQKIKNPILYLKKMNLRWSKSIYLANKMMSDEV